MALIATDECGTCNQVICPIRLSECPASDVIDICGCCPTGVCGKLEGERCYSEKIEMSNKRLGLCGSNMECLPRQDEDEKVNSIEPPFSLVATY